MVDFEEGTFIWAHNFKQVTAQMHVGEMSLSGVFKWKEAFPLRAHHLNQYAHEGSWTNSHQVVQYIMRFYVLRIQLTRWTQSGRQYI